MKIVCAYVLTYDVGSRQPWGLPAFASEEDAAGFMDFVREELEGGVVEFLAERRKATGKKGKPGARPAGFSARVRRKTMTGDTAFALERLLAVGQRSCNQLRARQTEFDLAREPRQQQLQRSQSPPDQEYEMDLMPGCSGSRQLDHGPDLELSR